VNNIDPTGEAAISLTILLVSIIGGAIAGAAINTVSYLTTNEDTTFAGAADAFILGAIVGGLGGAAGVCTAKTAAILCLCAGAFSGGYTFYNTEGPFMRRMLAAWTAFRFTAGAAYLGSLISFEGLSAGMTLAGNAIFGMTIGGYFELANVTAQRTTSYIFETLVPAINNKVEGILQQKGKNSMPTAVHTLNAQTYSYESAPKTITIFP